MGCAAGIISLAGFFPYAVAIVRGHARPNRATWLIWSVVSALLFASYDASVGGAARWVPLSDTVGTAAIGVLSFRHGEGGLGRFDVTCLALAGLSALAWGLTGSADIALGMNIFVAVLGALPTVRKAHADPASESLLTWCIFLAGNSLNLVAIEAWSVKSAAYPLYAALVAALVTTLLLRRAPGPVAPMKARAPRVHADKPRA